MAYATRKDAIYQDYAGAIRLMPEDAEDYECISVSFGKVNRGNGTETGYEEDVSVIEASITERYEQILENRERRAEQNEEWEKMREEEAAGEDALERDGGQKTEESIYEKEARLICEKIRESIDIGEEFSVEYNARGYEYYLLGADGTYQYTLLYDRDSANGECRLYVLYRSPYNAESGSYYYYADTMTQIADVYAVVIETGKTISSGKRAWSDIGTEEYRNATGE